MNKPTILLVEDDKAIRSLLHTALGLRGYACHMAETGTASILDAVSHQPDTIILDLGLPDMDGVELIKKIRGWSNVPIIVVSARSEDQDKIDALDAGADDYLTKPFSIDELLARVRVSLRRVRQDRDKLQKDAAAFTNGRLRVDYAAGCVYLDNMEVHLTPTEYKLLCFLCKNAGKVVTHNAILREVWGQYTTDVSALRMAMASLRGKIEPNPDRTTYIQTHIGVGYRMLHIAPITKTDNIQDIPDNK